ncbi:MAG: D-aminoacyl-tRNA deacylase, partial [Crocinitomicaceae bacterium]
MRIVIQRVTEASLKIEGTIYAEIANGLVVLLGIEHTDSQEDVDYLVAKLPRGLDALGAASWSGHMARDAGRARPDAGRPCPCTREPSRLGGQACVRAGVEELARHTGHLWGAAPGVRLCT